MVADKITLISLYIIIIRCKQKSRSTEEEICNKIAELSFINSEIIVPNLKKSIFATKKF